MIDKPLSSRIDGIFFGNVTHRCKDRVPAVSVLGRPLNLALKSGNYGDVDIFRKVWGHHSAP